MALSLTVIGWFIGWYDLLESIYSSRLFICWMDCIWNGQKTKKKMQTAKDKFCVPDKFIVISNSERNWFKIIFFIFGDDWFRDFSSIDACIWVCKYHKISVHLEFCHFLCISWRCYFIVLEARTRIFFLFFCFFLLRWINKRFSTARVLLCHSLMCTRVWKYTLTVTNKHNYSSLLFAFRLK